MVIISQNRDAIVPFNSPIFVAGNEIIMAESGRVEITLGTYKNQQDAMKVLNKIIEAHHYCLDEFEMPKEEEI